MRRTTGAFIIGIISIVYWLLFWIVIFSDSYLTWPRTGAILKIFFYPIILLNSGGIIFGITLWKKTRSKALGLISVNVFPLVVTAGFFFWLFFWFKM